MEKQPLPDEYVCPNCGTPARGATECRACGVDLDELTELPRHREYISAGPESARVEFIEKPAEEAAAPRLAGGLWARVGANIVDNLVVTAAIAGVGLTTYAVAGEDAGYAAAGIAYGVIILLYAPLMLAFVRGQTLGKQALSVQVRNVSGDSVGFGRAFLREFLKLIFGLFLLPLIASGLIGLFRSDKRTLHDLMLGTKVIRTD